MKKFSLLFFFIIILFVLNSQEPEIIYSAPDSLYAIPDSLAIYSDTLSSQIKKETQYNVIKLKQDINDYIDKNTLKELDFFNTKDFVITENFHLKTLFTQPAMYRKNDFTYFTPFGRSDLLFQKLAVLQNLEFSNNLFSFGQKQYKQPVTLVESYLGLGDNEMNHALVSLKKYEFMGIPNLGVRADYLGQEGFWLDENENSKNFYFSSFYDYKWLQIGFFYHKIDEELPGQKVDKTSKVDWDSEEFGFKLENKFVDIGYRQDTSSLDNEEINTKVLLLNKNLSLPHNTVQVSYEKFWQNEEFSLSSLAHQLSYKILNWENNGYYKSEDEYFFSSYLQNRIYKNYGLAAEFTKTEDVESFEEYGAGFFADASYLKAKLLYGELNIDSLSSNYISSQINLTIDFDPVMINLKSNLQWIQKENDYYPQWRQQYNLGISYNLPYNNSVNLNFIYQNFQKFSTSGADLLNTRLSLDITKNFDIKAEVINILGEKSIKDYTLSSTHYILGVNWYFLN